MNIYKKLAEAREELQNGDLTKSGHNKFANFNYYELKDFIPTINAINKKIGILTMFSIEGEQATLEIINVDEPSEIITFKTPKISAEMKGANPIQSLGATHTYLKRYLYLNAYEIVENDIVDSLPSGSLPNTKYSKTLTIAMMKDKGQGYVDKAKEHYKVFELEEIQEEDLKKIFDKLK